MINKMLRILAVLVVIYFLAGAFLDAYYDIVIYPASLAAVFEPIAKHIQLIHEAAVEALEKVMNASRSALRDM